MECVVLIFRSAKEAGPQPTTASQIEWGDHAKHDGHLFINSAHSYRVCDCIGRGVSRSCGASVGIRILYMDGAIQGRPRLQAMDPRCRSTKNYSSMTCEQYPLTTQYKITLYKDNTSKVTAVFHCNVGQQVYTWTGLPSGNYHFRLTKGNDGSYMDGSGTVVYP